MEKYLVLLDLDGTLLNDASKIPAYNKQVIQALQEEGHHVVIVTGRAYYRSHWFYDELGLNTILFNRNSSHIHHPLDPSFEPQLTVLEKETIQQLMDESIRGYYEKIYFESENHVYVLKGDKEFYLNEWYQPLILHDREELDFPLIHDVNLIQVFIKPEDLDRYRSFLQTFNDIEYAFFTVDDRLLVQIHPKEGNKQHAIAYLSDYYHIPRERVIAMGDGENDIDMLKAAGIGVAMVNAKDIIKEHADRITEYSNDESGVGHFLKEYFKLAI